MQAILGVEFPAAWPSAAAVAAGRAGRAGRGAGRRLVSGTEAQRISPVEGIAGIEPGGGDRYPWQALAASLLVWTAAVICLGLVVSEAVPGRLAIPAGLTMLVAFILLIPAVMGPLVAGLAALLPRSWQAEALVATRQIQQRRTRAALTVGVLVVALSNGVGLGHAILNNINDVQSWYRRNMSGDYVLRQIQTPAPGSPLDAEAQTLADLKAVPAVAGVTSVRIRSARLAGEPVLCVIRDFASDRSLPWNLTPEQEATLRTQLAAGKSVVSSVLARRVLSSRAIRSGWSCRDAPMRSPWLLKSTTTPLAAWRFSSTAARPRTCSSLGRRTSTSSPASGPGRGCLAAAGVNRPRTRAEPCSRLPTCAAPWTPRSAASPAAPAVLMAVGFLVGGFGVANTLAMSVLEQTRELGLLRIVGMSRRQVGRLVLVESIFLGLASVCLGVLAGLTTALVIHLCNRALLDRDVPFQFHPLLLVGNVAVCLLVAVAAAWIPGWRASRIDLLSAIAYE